MTCSIALRPKYRRTLFRGGRRARNSSCTCVVLQERVQINIFVQHGAHTHREFCFIKFQDSRFAQTPMCNNIVEHCNMDPCGWLMWAPLAGNPMPFEGEEHMPLPCDVHKWQHQQQQHCWLCRSQTAHHWQRNHHQSYQSCSKWRKLILWLQSSRLLLTSLIVTRSKTEGSS